MVGTLSPKVWSGWWESHPFLLGNLESPQEWFKRRVGIQQVEKWRETLEVEGTACSKALGWERLSSEELKSQES